MRIKIKPIKIKQLIKEVKIPQPKLPPMRLPRGPTVRWSIDYNKLFKKGKK